MPDRARGTDAAAAVEWTRYEAVLFDLDGVLTATARLHAAAWTRLFDGYLAERAAAEGGPFRPFEPRDYARYVDGRPRYDGVRAFLASRGITLPDGAPDDPPGDATVCGLGNRKQAFFHDVLASEGADTIPGTVAVVRHLRHRSVRTAVVSSSRNCAAILESASLAGLFELQVDGVVAAELGLAGKPAPDTFLHAARTMGVAPARAAVVEDAIAGVAAGRAGGFGLVVGIDRAGVPDELARAGADLVVTDLADTLPDATRTDAAHEAAHTLTNPARSHASNEAIHTLPEVTRTDAAHQAAPSPTDAARAGTAPETAQTLPDGAPAAREDG